MINKGIFINTINNYKEFYNNVDKLEKLLKCCLIDSFLINDYGLLFDYFINTNFNESAQDTIYWWLFEKSNNPDLKMLINDIEIPSDTVEELWEIVKDDVI